jgi:NADPH:quinone reductase-like Zn-dependent oxidoreductase
LRLDDVPVPEPKDDEVLVKVMAASINPIDIRIRTGYRFVVKPEDLPVQIGRDASGIVEACGPSARDVKNGDAVFVLLGRGRGAYGEFVIAKANERALKPDTLTHVQAAALPLAAITAWNGLFDQGALTAGERVLIHAGNGGVGHLAVQFAKLKGAWVATTCSAGDVAFVKSLGADQAIDYRSGRFEDVVQPVDLVLDLVAGDTRERSLAVLKKGGRLMSAISQAPVDKGRELGLRVASYAAEVSPALLAEIAALVASGRVKVEIQQTFALRDAARAHEALENTHTRGKIVLDMAM